MQETQTKIQMCPIKYRAKALKQIHGIRYNVERVITIRGSVEGMSMAESLISAKLKRNPEIDLFSQALRSSFAPPAFFPLCQPAVLGNPYAWDEDSKGWE